MNFSIWAPFINKNEWINSLSLSSELVLQGLGMPQLIPFSKAPKVASSPPPRWLDVCRSSERPPDSPANVWHLERALFFLTKKLKYIGGLSIISPPRTTYITRNGVGGSHSFLVQLHAPHPIPKKKETALVFFADPSLFWQLLPLVVGSLDELSQQVLMKERCWWKAILLWVKNGKKHNCHHSSSMQTHIRKAPFFMDVLVPFVWLQSFTNLSIHISIARKDWLSMTVLQRCTHEEVLLSKSQLLSSVSSILGCGERTSGSQQTVWAHQNWLFQCYFNSSTASTVLHTIPQHASKDIKFNNFDGPRCISLSTSVHQPLKPHVFKSRLDTAPPRDLLLCGVGWWHLGIVHCWRRPGQTPVANGHYLPCSRQMRGKSVHTLWWAEGVEITLLLPRLVGK